MSISFLPAVDQEVATNLSACQLSFLQIGNKSYITNNIVNVSWQQMCIQYSDKYQSTKELS